MNFDLTITVADVLVVAGTFASTAWMLIKARDRARDTTTKIAALKQEKDSEVRLLTQRVEFNERSAAEDVRRSESHWSEVKEWMQRIMDRLDDKADKHA